MNMAIQDIRIFPPLALARLGSSPEPLDNYELAIPDAVAPRKIVGAESLSISPDGELTAKPAASTVQFRDRQGRIKPVAPFFEIWARMDQSEDWVPLTLDLLAANGLGASAVEWNAAVGNIKIFRRTGDPNDRIEAAAGPIRDHASHPLNGTCANFIQGESVHLGSVQFVRPSAQHPEFRLRFTPAHGKVYGTSTDPGDPNVVRPVYDGDKGRWRGYSETSDTPPNDYDGRKLTNPANIFAGFDQGSLHVSYGYVDDECDGIVEATLSTGGGTLRAFARVAAGPPTFAPDSKPVRTVADELEQALLGPDVAASGDEVEAVRDIVRRALETVRLMNTGQMNKGGTTRGVGMARMDRLDYGRMSEPIFDPVVADSLAIRSRHERVLLALESGSLAWFAGVLREYDKVGDLTDAGRRKMPGMMRNADGRHLALTRRQVSKVKAVANYIAQKGADASSSEPTARISPLNLAAQLDYRAAGNPPNSKPDTAISNAYPGLEMDARNLWKRILTGVELHESLNFVLEANAGFEELKGMLLLSVAGVEMTAPVTGPAENGVTAPLQDAFGSSRMALEWSNALAGVLHGHAGGMVECVFQSLDGKRTLTRSLRLRPMFEEGTAVVARELAEPGALTQSLCAPWQNDYRECACFYWAANRPDYVNVEPRTDGTSAGNNWMQKDRTADTPKVYINDDWQDDRLYSHTDLVRDWEKLLRFVIANQDEPPVA